MAKLQGKTAIITGATGGIGEASARRFLEEGANLMLIGRSEEKLKSLVMQLDGGRSVASYVSDAADEAALTAAVKATEHAFGRIDIVFANAGIEGDSKPLEEQSRNMFENVLRTNVIGVWLAMKLCAKQMKAQRSGSMIATS